MAGRAIVCELCCDSAGETMMLQTFIRPVEPKPAVVSKAGSKVAEYLRVGPSGDVVWVRDPASATPFQSMKEAARMALKLPAVTRAFGLPLHVELDLYRAEQLH